METKVVELIGGPNDGDRIILEEERIAWLTEGNNFYIQDDEWNPGSVYTYFIYRAQGRGQ